MFGEQAVATAIRKKIEKYFNILIALAITTSGFESSLKIQHICRKEKDCHINLAEHIIFQQD